MSKTNYKGNFTKEEHERLEQERQEELEELKVRKARDMARRKARGNRHPDWGED